MKKKSAPRPKKTHLQLSPWLIILILLLPVLVWAVYQQINLRSKASAPRSLADFGEAVQLNGGYLLAENSQSFTNLSYATLAAWIYPTRVNSNNSTILGKQYYPPNAAGWEWHIRPDLKLELWYAIWYNNRWATASVVSTSPIILNSWQYVAVTFSPQRIEFFINGIKSGSFPSESNVLGYAEDNKPGSNIVIGSHCRQTNLAPKCGDISLTPFYGKIDEVLISNNVIYTQDFSVPTTPHDTTGGQLGLWHFDTHTSTTTPDSGGADGDHPAFYYPGVTFIPSDLFSPTPTPTPVVCTPRPACLDAKPACKPVVPKGGWCPAPKPKPTSSPRLRPTIVPPGRVQK